MDSIKQFVDLADSIVVIQQHMIGNADIREAEASHNWNLCCTLEDIGSDLAKELSSRGLSTEQVHKAIHCAKFGRLGQLEREWITIKAKLLSINETHEWTEPLTQKQIGTRLNRSERTIQRWMKSGELPFRKVGGAYRIPTNYDTKAT